MAGVSFPVTRSAGEALVVASPAARGQIVATLATLGIAAAECDDPYAAMAELCRRPMVFRAVILSLAGVYTEELEIIPAIARRFPHVEIWLTHTDGRYSSLAEAMRLGAAGLLADDGLHRIAGATGATPPRSGRIDQAAETRSLNTDPAPQPADASLTPPDDSASSGRHDPESADFSHASHPVETGLGEPILTADELRALLQESPPAGAEPETGLA
jgi:hypothetical protein